MTLVIESVRVKSFPGGSIGGSTSQTVKYDVVTNETAPSTDIIEACWQANKMPTFGGVFDVTADGRRFQNAALFATEFKHTNTFETEGKKQKHAIEVTFESADVAVGTTTGNTTNPNRLIDPLLRPDEKTIEYLVAQEEVRRARNVGKFENKDDKGVVRTMRKANTLGPIVNTAGFPVKQRFFKTVKRTVFVWRKYVSSYVGSLAITRQFEDTYNAGRWNGSEPHHTAFESAEVSGPEWWNGQPRFLLTVRVVESNKPWYLQVDNVGDQYWKGGKQIAITDSSGVPLEEAPLTLNGEPMPQADEDTVPILLNYTHYDATDYDELTQMIESYK